MSDKELEIFKLCERLTELLGDKEAIADLKKLYEKHPEMFKNMQDVSQTIKEVVTEAEIVTDAKRKGAKLVATMLKDSRKMGEVAIENDEGTNIIFHANKKNISKSNYFKKNKQMLVETPSAKAAPTRSDRCADKSSDLSRDYKVLSTSVNDIIPQTNENQSIAQQAKDMLKELESDTNKNTNSQNSSQESTEDSDENNTYRT